MDAMRRHEHHVAEGALDPPESVRVADDFRAILAVPFTPDQLAELQGVADERGIGAIQAVQELVAESLVERQPLATDR